MQENRTAGIAADRLRAAGGEGQSYSTEHYNRQIRHAHLFLTAIFNPVHALNTVFVHRKPAASSPQKAAIDFIDDLNAKVCCR